MDRFLGWQDADQAIRVRLLETFCRGVRPRSILTNTATLVLMAALLWPDLPHAPLIAWVLVAVAGGFGLRLYVSTQEHRPGFYARPTRQAVILAGIVFLYGLAWGAGPFLFYADAAPTSKAILLIVVILTAVMSPYAAIPGLQTARFVPAAALTLIAVVRDGDMVAAIAAVAFTIWLFLRMDIVRAYHGVIRQQFELQDRLRSQSAELERSNAVKSDFLAVMSHEIRNPMNGILSMIHLIESQAPQGKLAEYVGHLRSASSHLAGLLNDILDLSRLEEGEVSVEPQPFDLDRLAREVSAIVESSARQKNLDLSLTVAAPLADNRWRLGDAKLIRQVLLNLLGNAVKFTDTGGVTLSVGDNGARPDMVTFAVADTGPGMTAAELKSAFEPFTQLEAANARQHGGTGLGLSIVNRLVEAMGGEIRAESRPGAGTTFTVEIPLPPTAVEVKAPAPAPEAAALPAARLLVVDDSNFNRMVIRELLSNAPLDIDEAASGAAALERFAVGRYQAIITDLQMPGMDGLELIAEIRRREQAAGAAATPILVVTAAAFAKDRDAALRAGGTAYLSKPISVPALMAVLREHLSGAGESVPMPLEHLKDKLHAQLNADLAALQAAMADADGARAARVIHAARGHCGLFGMNEIGEALSALETDLETGGTAALTEGVERMQALLAAPFK